MDDSEYSKNRRCKGLMRKKMPSACYTLCMSVKNAPLISVYRMDLKFSGYVESVSPVVLQLLETSQY